LLEDESGHAAKVNPDTAGKDSDVFWYFSSSTLWPCSSCLRRLCIKRLTNSSHAFALQSRFLSARSSHPTAATASLQHLRKDARQPRDVSRRGRHSRNNNSRCLPGWSKRSLIIACAAPKPPNTCQVSSTQQPSDIEEASNRARDEHGGAIY
jgi:hypothetical protein